MFNRAQNIAHICLRCQRRLAQQQPQWISPRVQVFPRQQVRSQSTAAARVDEEDDQIEPHPPIESFDTPPTERPRNSTRSRRWRPSPTADLGMNALGKPSEIILLSETKREIPVVPEGMDEETKESLHDSITSEKLPLSWEEAKANINQAREQLGQQRGTLSLAKWEGLSLTLRKGFQKGQLRRYVNETWSRTPEQSAALNLQHASRPKMAYFIATGIWGYRLPPEALASLGKEDQEALGPKKSTIPDADRELTMSIRKDATDWFKLRMDSFAKEHGVHLSMKLNRLTLQGPRDLLDTAQLAMKALMKSVTVSVIKQESYLPSLPENFSQQDRQHGFIANATASLRQKYGILVTTEAHSGQKIASNLRFRVCHLANQKELLQEVRREIWRIQSRIVPRTIPHTPFCSAKALSNLILGPAYTTSNLYYGTNKQFYRLHDVHTPQKAAPSQDEKDAACIILDNHLNFRSSNSVTTVPAKQLIHEYTAGFGQALFASSKSQPLSEKRIVDMKPVFTSEAPFVPQLLTHSKFQETKAERPNESTTRLRLIPHDPKSKAPSFEIYLTGMDSATSPAEPPTITSAEAVIDERTRSVPRPSKAVDLKFTRRSKLTLFTAERPANAMYATLYQELRDYVGASTSRPPPFVHLKVPSSMLLRTAEKVLKSKIGKKAKAKAKARSAPKPGPGPEEEVSRVQYVLEGLDLLDIDSRVVKAPGFKLHHVTTQGGEFDPDRQELILKHMMPATQTFAFKDFFKAAMDIAKQIDGLGRQLRHRLESGKS